MPSDMKESLPLGSNGRMECLTCHSCISGTCNLRKEHVLLCKVCHSCTQGMSCLIGIAHLGSSKDSSRISEAGCLSCHDGLIAPERGRDLDHRVDVLYLASKHKKMKDVRDRRIVFVDGKVTCVSCHDPYRSQKMRLVKSNHNSRLCLTCHDQ